MQSRVYLAVDLGASSGRVLAGKLDGQRLHLDEVHRFTNGPRRAVAHLHWDLLALWQEIIIGLRRAGAQYGRAVRSVGVDTWGVDYGLLGADDELLGNPHHYRDPRTQGALEAACRIVPRSTIFAETGLQFMELNTLFQLFATLQRQPQLLDLAERLLMMPDLFHWLMTGEKTNEMTNASTTQLFNPHLGNWSQELIAGFGFPDRIFGPIVPPGTAVGRLLPHVATETNLADVQVVLPATHDTASAVAAVPTSSTATAPPDWCYISSGTWSLMGIESPVPLINSEVERWTFTNEGGVDGTTRLLKNISGLWLAQECKRIWQRQGQDFSWEQLTQLAAEAEGLESLVAPDDPRLVAPDDMPAALAQLCAENGQRALETPGQTVRCALESLALRYQQVLVGLESICGAHLATVHIVGGGTQNALLCQLAADACGRPVVAGPVEATAIGNVLMQAIADGQVSGLAEARQIVQASFPVVSYEPAADRDRWLAAIERFGRLSG